MNKQLFLAIILLASIHCFGQIKYESGYYINNNGIKINCLIKNVDWKSNPTKFSYKISESSEANTITTDSAKEFGLYNQSKYVRYKVNIDRSSEEVSYLSAEKAPNFKKETLFLKPLVEGKATLYSYVDGNLTRYFYTLDTANAQQLVFKSYMDDNHILRQNNTYRNQLWTKLQSPNVTMGDIEKVKYNAKDLSKVFYNYNQANGNVSTVIAISPKNVKRDFFNLNLRPGISNASLKLESYDYLVKSVDFGSKQNLWVGVEAEFILPFNRNKWAILIEPNYRYFKSTVNQGMETYTADLKTLEIPLGVRHSFFINDNNKIFVNASYVFLLDAGSSIKKDDAPFLETRANTLLQSGVGYNYKKRYSIELRVDFKRNILNRYLYWSTNYTGVSFILGYNIF